MRIILEFRKHSSYILFVFVLNKVKQNYIYFD